MVAENYGLLEIHLFLASRKGFWFSGKRRAGRGEDVFYLCFCAHSDACKNTGFFSTCSVGIFSVPQKVFVWQDALRWTGGCFFIFSAAF